MSDISGFYMFIPYALVGLGEVLVNPVLYYVAYTTAPVSARGMVQALNLVAQGAIPNAFTSAISSSFPEWQPDDLNKGHLEYFYYVAIAVIVLGTPLFCFVSHPKEDMSKYNDAGILLDEALRKIGESCVDGASVKALCISCDSLIDKKCSNYDNQRKSLLQWVVDVFRQEKPLLLNKERPTMYREASDSSLRAQSSNISLASHSKRNCISKGIAFPTCIEVNNMCGHFSPITSESDRVLKKGDVVQISAGVQLDGHIVYSGKTIVVGVTSVKGRKADVIMAAWTAAEAAARCARIGVNSRELTAAVLRTAKAFNCNVVEGVLLHQIKRNKMDGSKVIQLPADPLDAGFEFAPNEAYCINVVMSTGRGKPQPDMEHRTSVIQTTAKMEMSEDEQDALPQKTRALVEHIRREGYHVNNTTPAYPFTLRSIEDEIDHDRVDDAIKRGLVRGFPVMRESEGEYVAQFSFTLLTTGLAQRRVTSLPLSLNAIVQSEYIVADEYLLDLLARTLECPERRANTREIKIRSLNSSIHSTTTPVTL